MLDIFKDLMREFLEEVVEEMEKQKKKNLGMFRVKIYVQGTSLKVNIESLDPENLLIVAGGVVATLRKNDMEPTVEMQP